MKLIDKDAVVAEIENLLDKGKYHEEYDCAYRDGNNGALDALKNKLDTIEVKEVNLDAEISLWVRNLHRVPNFEELNKFAKHFFELGLKAKKKYEQTRRI